MSVFFWVCKDNVAGRAVAVEGEEGLESTTKPVGKSKGAEGVVLQQCNQFIQAIDVGVDHILKSLKTLSLFGNHGPDGVLHGRGDSIRKYRDKLHPEVG